MPIARSRLQAFVRGARLAWPAVAALVLGAGTTLLFGAGAAPGGPLSRTHAAPRFECRDLRGGRVELSELLHRGPVLIDFWATWCKPCVESLPRLEAWQRQYGPSGLTVLGVSVDGPRNFSKVRPFVASLGLTYPIVIDKDGRLQQLYQVLAVPMAFLIDTSGVVIETRTGYRPGEDAALEAAIRAALPSAPGP